MIKVESPWLCFNSLLFSLALMGICCKNSSWCNGTAYAKISHKPPQFILTSFSFTLGMFILTFTAFAFHMLAVNLSLTLFCHPHQVQFFYTLNIPSCLFLEMFCKNSFLSIIFEPYVFFSSFETWTNSLPCLFENTPVYQSS